MYLLPSSDIPNRILCSLRKVDTFVDVAFQNLFVSYRGTLKIEPILIVIFLPFGNINIKSDYNTMTASCYICRFVCMIRIYSPILSYPFQNVLVILFCAINLYGKYLFFGKNIYLLLYCSTAIEFFQIAKTSSMIKSINTVCQFSYCICVDICKIGKHINQNGFHDESMFVSKSIMQNSHFNFLSGIMYFPYSFYLFTKRRFIITVLLGESFHYVTEHSFPCSFAHIKNLFIAWVHKNINITP